MRKFLFFILVIGLFSIVNIEYAYADNANMTIETETEECETDKVITVNIKIEADSDIKKVEAVLKYNSEILEFKRGGSFVTLDDEGFLKLYDTSVSGGKDRDYSVTFRTIKNGIVKIGCDRVPEIIATSGSKFVSSFTDLYIEVKGVAIKDTDSTLKSLKISPGTLDKEFKTSQKSYKLNVPYSSKSVVINAEPTSKKATVTISGEDKLKVGNNKVKVLVMAEDESETEYVINVTRCSEDEQLILDRKNYIKSKKDKGNVYQESNGMFIINDSEYEILSIIESDDMELPVGYKKSTMNLYGSEIDVCLLEKDPQNDIFLIYAKNTESGDEGYYQYDRVERTLQRFFGETVTIGNEKSKDSFENVEYNDKLRVLGIIIGVLAVLFVVVMVFAIKMMINIRTIKNDNYLI